MRTAPRRRRLAAVPFFSLPMPTRYVALLGLLLALAGPADAATCTWAGGTAAWQTPSAWSCNAVPGPADDVVIAAGAVTFSAPAAGPGAVTVRSFTMTGGTLDGDGTVTVTGALVWEAGTMSGTGATLVLGSATFGGATAKNVGRTVTLRGATTWSGGTVQFRDGGILVNEGTFTDNATGSHSLARAGAITTEPYVLNRGTWTVESVGTNGNVSFLNAGTLVVAGAGFKVNAPARFELADTGVLVGSALLDVASGPAVSMAGRTAPGGAAVASLPVRGPFPMTDRHVLDLDLTGGVGAFDRLLVENGTVTVDGRLHVRIQTLTVPEQGAAFPVLAQTGSGDVVGCYAPSDITVTGPDGVTPAPYRVEVACTADGVTATVFAVSTAGEGDPAAARARLAVTGANPFARRTTLALTAAVAGPATVEAVDALGRRVAVLFEGAVAAGRPVPVVFDAGSLPAGPYVVRATGDGFVLTRTVTVAR